MDQPEEIHSLPLVFVQTFRLDIENGIRVDCNTLGLLKPFRKRLFIFRLDIPKVGKKCLILPVIQQFLSILRHPFSSRPRSNLFRNKA